ncbi:DUF2175 family protein [Picrophilus oshimae]|uniref:DUF2175 domain-containing protein n=1 Tax=Picrophilus torridus (strain ATCC 700027 / DSM 9790 / JCM 10055 / NBRC 100828 / KAW 2/3) TaxID=1122961 RepID=Q6L0P6_PICTO|nr:DUF2175 family protein [Picrophilus oshimae]AAT43456.1 hypothetical protein PTO0871 [Picrophilus oshimae DSM 9789]SMD30235.1 hypothetical protein SAMN02745355_0102 [Picrophilus oshimae DSM 9789]
MEYKCYICKKAFRSGEKFTFTKEGSVHLDCFVSDKRLKIEENKIEKLRTLSLILDYELTYLVELLNIKPEDDESKEITRQKIKELEKASGETTKMIYEL